MPVKRKQIDPVTYRSQLEIIDDTDTAQSDEYWILLSAATGDAAVNLPAAPADGEEHSITALDVTNACAVNGNGHNIRWSPANDSASFSLIAQFDTITVRYDSTTEKWYVV